MPTRKLYAVPAREALAEFITKSGCTVGQCAEECGTTERTLYNWLSGVGRADVGTASAIAAWTAGVVPVSAWLTDEEALLVARMRP